MTPAAEAFARRLDAIAATDFARDCPLHEALYLEIGDLIGGLGYDPSGNLDTLAGILKSHCERAAQDVLDEAGPRDYQPARPGIDAESYISDRLQDEMDRAYANACEEFYIEAQLMAGPMLAERVGEVA